jgi:hypothetical protein
MEWQNLPGDAFVLLDSKGIHWRLVILFSSSGREDPAFAQLFLIYIFLPKHKTPVSGGSHRFGKKFNDIISSSCPGYIQI